MIAYIQFVCRQSQSTIPVRLTIVAGTLNRQVGTHGDATEDPVALGWIIGRQTWTDDDAIELFG